MAIAIVQTGLSRFTQVTKTNHLELYQMIKDRYGSTVYDFYRKQDNPLCPFGLSGKVQVFDFVTGRDQVSEDIMLKIRSDVYFTRSSMQVVCQELDKIIGGYNDISYMGLDFLNDYDKEYSSVNARHAKKVTDFVIAARCSSVEKTDRVIEILSNSVKDKSGNKTFYNILTPEARATKVSCQMYLIRKEYTHLNNWQVYWDWSSQYNKSPVAQEWVKNNREQINAF